MKDDVKLKDPGTCRIFFSSPFGGMEVEREELTKRYFPEIHHVCNAKGIKFVPVDMRWGITKEAADSAQVMSICLREVERSDFFVGFYGQRYGWHSEDLTDSMLMQNFDNAMGATPWIDKFRDRSVTEVEWRAGHLNNPGDMPACFCFRDKEYDESRKEEALQVQDQVEVLKYTTESEYSVKKMNSLIHEITETKDKTLGVLLNYKSPQEVAKFIFQTIWKFLTEVLLKDVNEDGISHLIQQRQVHDQFVKSMTQVYSGCENYGEELIKKIEDTKGTVVTGPVGCGKSALLANFVATLKTSCPYTELIYHFIGCAPGTEKPENILERILLELKDLFPNMQTSNQTTDGNSTAMKDNVDKSESNDLDKDKKSNDADESKTDLKVTDNCSDSDQKKDEETDGNKIEKEKNQNDITEKQTALEMLTAIESLMENISKNGHKVVIILDGLNQQNSLDKTIKHLYWLPKSFPDGVKLICSTLDTDTLTHDLLVSQRGMDTLPIVPFDSQLQKSICIETLKVAGKEFSPHQLECVISAKETSNALFLKLVLYELSIYGDFSKLDEKINSLIHLNGVKLLLQVILDRLEMDYNSEDYKGNLVKDVLCCLRASRKGLSESELTEMLNIPTHLWSPLFFAFEHLLSQYTGLLGFAFSAMSEAVSDRYLSDPSEISHYKKIVISYFDGIRKKMKPWVKESKPEFDRMVEELPWLQTDINDKEGLIQTLSDLSILRKIVVGDEYQLLYLWQQTDLPWRKVSAIYMKRFDESIADLYDEYQNEVYTTSSPGMKLRVAMQYLRILFEAAYYHRGTQVAMEREIKILETCKAEMNAEKREELLRDSRYNLACSYSNQNDNDKALPLHMAVHEQCQKLIKEKDDKEVKKMIAYTCNGIGLIYYHERELPKAKEFLEKSMKMHQEMKDEQNEASSHTNLGLAYMEGKEYKQAIEHFEIAMQLYEKTSFGKVSLDIGNVLTNLALTYRRMKDLKKAETYYHKSVEIKALVVGCNHPVLATAYMNLGSLESVRKTYKKAIEWTKKAIAIYEFNEYPVTQRQHRFARENLCMNIMKLNKHKEALPLYIEITNIMIENGWLHELLIGLHHGMLEYMLEEGMYEEVEKFTLAILATPKRRAKFAYILADLDSKQPITTRVVRPKELTLEHFLEEYPEDNSLKTIYVTSILAQENRVEEIIVMCNYLHDKEKNLKETAYAFAVESLTDFQFYESAERVAEIGLKKYPSEWELLSEALKCWIHLKRVDELSRQLPVLLTTTPIGYKGGEELMKVGQLFEGSHPDLAGQCYRKIYTDLCSGNINVMGRKAREAYAKLFPEEPPASQVTEVEKQES